MNFWKRIRWIGSALVLALWLVALIAESQLGDRGPQLPRPLACTTNCL